MFTLQIKFTLTFACTNKLISAPAIKSSFLPDMNTAARIWGLDSWLKHKILCLKTCREIKWTRNQTTVFRIWSNSAARLLPRVLTFAPWTSIFTIAIPSPLIVNERCCKFEAGFVAETVSATEGKSLWYFWGSKAGFVLQLHNSATRWMLMQSKHYLKITCLLPSLTMKRTYILSSICKQTRCLSGRKRPLKSSNAQHADTKGLFCVAPRYFFTVLA